MHLLIVDLSAVYLAKRFGNLDYKKLVEAVGADKSVAFSQVDPNSKPQQFFIEQMAAVFDEVITSPILMRPDATTAAFACMPEIAYKLGKENYDELTLIGRCDMLLAPIVGKKKPADLYVAGMFNAPFWARHRSNDLIKVQSFWNSKYHKEKTVRPEQIRPQVVTKSQQS